MRRAVSIRAIAILCGFLFAEISCQSSDTPRWRAQFEWHKGDATRVYGWEPTLEAIQNEADVLHRTRVRSFHTDY